MRRRLAYLFGLLVLLIIVRGLWLGRYEPESSDAYLWGAFHVHSTLSDGLGTISEIAAQAKESRIDFVLMSDHGAPHPEAALLDETIDGVRFIGGSEVGMPDGHLIVSDVDALPHYKLPPFPPDAASDVAEWGGFSVLTYPEDPTHRWMYWENDFVPNGIEIINVTSYFRASSHWDKLLWAVFSIFNRNYYVSSFERPTYALERWDELLTRGKVFGLYAANAHGGFPLSEETTIGIPSYATAMGFVGIGVDRRFAHAPEHAVRRGAFFSVVRGAGEPRRFEFDREGVRVDVERLTTRIVLKRDGAVIAEAEGAELSHTAVDPGVYRAEVYLPDHPLLAPDVPWILSNPIYVDVDYEAPRPEKLECESMKSVDLDSLHVEKDDASTATFTEDLVLSYELSQATEEDVNRWVALALREPMDLSGYRGIYLEARSPEPMRYWLEVRAGERSHYASFKLRGDVSEQVFLPWSRFYAIFGGREEIPLSELDQMFITVNTSNSRTGFSSSLSLTKLGFCR